MTNYEDDRSDFSESVLADIAKIIERRDGPDKCTFCGRDIGHDDTRVHEQRASDIASATLANLADLHHDLTDLRHQLVWLADWAAEHDMLAAHYYLTHMMTCIDEFIDGAVAVTVEDIAAALPSASRADQ